MSIPGPSNDHSVVARALRRRSPALPTHYRGHPPGARGASRARLSPDNAQTCQESTVTDYDSRLRMEALMGAQSGAYVEGFAIQVGSIWVAIPILVAVVFGLWKLVKIIWVAFSN